MELFKIAYVLYYNPYDIEGLSTYKDIITYMLIKNWPTFPSASAAVTFSTLFLFKNFFTHSSTWTLNFMKVT